MLTNSENAGAIAHCDQSSAYTGPFVGYTPLPAGDYTLEIVESDYAAISKGTGMLLKLKCQVVGGEYDGRAYYINLALEHDNPEAQDIGQRDFAAMRHAIGVPNPDDTEQLHNRPFRVTIGQKLRKDAGEMENVVAAYLWDASREEQSHAA